MKHLKTFENIENENDIIKNFANYIIDESGLKKYNDGFTHYAIQDYRKYSEYYTYYFKFDLETFGNYEIGISKLKKFLKSINIKNIKRKKYLGTKNNIEISFDIERVRAKELAELYISTNKYNL